MDKGKKVVYIVLKTHHSHTYAVTSTMHRWSNMVAEGDKWKHGHPQLHKVAAMVYWRGQSEVYAQLSQSLTYTWSHLVIFMYSSYM